MTEPSLDPDRASDARPAAGTPRWVKVLAVVALLLLLLFLVLHLTGSGVSGPGSHLGSAVVLPPW